MSKLSQTLVFLATLVAGASCAHATSITYTFTAAPGNGNGGASFTYVSPTGFLAFDTGTLAPTTAGDLNDFGTDYGLLTGFDFVSPTEINFFATGGSLYANFGSPYQISALTSGEYLLFTGTLAITNTATVTPEPSSIALLGTGLLGVAGIVRKRFAM